MSDRFSRTELLLGYESVVRLRGSRVAVFGVGGVGGYCAEALCRCGVGAIDIVDSGIVDITNLNRQIIATQHTIGRKKVEVTAERLVSINPECRVRTHDLFYLPESADRIDLSVFDCVADAVDTVTAKLELAERLYRIGVPEISSMGTGNKLDPSRFEVSDIYKTSVCPLARVMRRELRKRGVPSLRVVYSREEPVRFEDSRRVPGSVPYVPPVAGLILASEVVRMLIYER